MKPRAVIFEEDPLIRQMLKAICLRRGYEVLSFPDPALCPLHTKKNCPCELETPCTDIIFSNLDMSSVKGLDFVEALLGNGCQCQHIALMSNDWTDRDTHRALDLGCKLFTKPLQVRQITRWLEQTERTLRPDRHLHALKSIKLSAKR
jgi:DNA-binding response OmpR family regulator